MLPLTPLQNDLPSVLTIRKPYYLSVVPPPGRSCTRRRHAAVPLRPHVAMLHRLSFPKEKYFGNLLALGISNASVCIFKRYFFNTRQTLEGNFCEPKHVVGLP